MRNIGVYSTATEMLDALARGDTTSVELVEMHLERIEQVDGELNAIPVRTPERARDAARAADRRRADGDTAPLLGLPLTLKESTRVAGLPQSAGIPESAGHVPDTDGIVAGRVFAAGGCLLGTTNIPFALSDWQADSAVYGRTLNPWDTSRSPGGSTGGGGAALAAGMTPLEIGSDIGGSIRVPAAFCGVYGHRPTETAIPRSASMPPHDLDNPAAIMGVQGPLARSAADLELMFDVVAGPVRLEDRAWRLEVPPARHESLDGFRVAVMPDIPFASPSRAMRAAVADLADFVSDAGAVVGEAMPPFDAEQYFHDYLATLMLITTQGLSEEQRRRAAERMQATGDPTDAARARGMMLSATEFLRLLDRREAARRAWGEFFEHWDVLVCPTAIDAAFPHTDGRFEERTLEIDGETVPYHHMVVYPMWAIFAGQPATAFPGGLDPRGLPLGLQAIGPYLEDRTPMRFAALLEAWNGFVPPPAYA
ncbi:MAG: amidase [Acidimicrobiaceae bacterium]|nr:amidase [Acidimicrobiaceae bacterium]